MVGVREAMHGGSRHGWDQWLVAMYGGSVVGVRVAMHGGSVHGWDSVVGGNNYMHRAVQIIGM